MPGGFLELIDDFEFPDWLFQIDTDLVLTPGERPGDPIQVPERQAAQILKSVVRLVADLPKPRGKDTTLDVVWTLGDSELMVHAHEIDLSCRSGVIAVELVVDCEQVDGPVEVRIPFGVGTMKDRRGLVMSTYDQLEAPREIAAIWTEALTAFAWESILELASRIAAEVGDDSRGRSLVPGAIGSASGALLVEVVARHDLVGGLS